MKHREYKQLGIAITDACLQPKVERIVVLCTMETSQLVWGTTYESWKPAEKNEKKVLLCIVQSE